ncbi:hypothetical protein N665_0180s0004 [Sinapis alba]|nr:hypothetical protein N665_0180s0004 [Sinapis alba]
MDNPRPTNADLAVLDDNERNVVRFSLELEDREATGHVPADNVEQENEPEPAQTFTPSTDVDSANKDKTSAEKEISFALADFLPMQWAGTDFEFDQEIDPEQECILSAKKNQNLANRLPTKSSFKSVWKLIFQTSPPAGFSFLIPAEHQRPWTLPSEYACVYESWFINCSLWWPLPEFLTTYCFRRKIALGQYTANGIRIMVTLAVLAAELGIRMSVCLFEELMTPSITAKTGFFYGKMVPKYNVITGKLPKVNFWNHRYFYVKINEASFKDPSIILNGYFNSNIDRLGKWSQGGSQSFLEEVEAIKTLSHQHWTDISEARIQAALNRINRVETSTEIPSRSRRQRMGKLNLASLTSYVDTIGTPVHVGGASSDSRPAKRRTDSNVDKGVLHVSPSRSPPSERLEGHLDDRNQDPLNKENPSFDPVGEAEATTTTEMPMEEHPVDPSVQEETQGGQFQELAPATHGGEVVKYPHVIDFCYQSADVPFVKDHEALARLFRQIKLIRRGMPELDQLYQDSRYQEMTQAGAIFFGNTNLMVRDYEAKLRAQDASLAVKTGSLKKKRKELAELAYKCSTFEGQINTLVAEKNEAVEQAELERSRNELLSKELEELKAQNEGLDTRCRNLEQEKAEVEVAFETTTRRLRESREHEVRKERLRVEYTLTQQVAPVYEKMRQFIEEKASIQFQLALYSQAKGTREGLEKIQTQGLSMDEVLQKARADEVQLLGELLRMEVVDTFEINLVPIGLDEHGSNMTALSPQDIEDLCI